MEPNRDSYYSRMTSTPYRTNPSDDTPTMTVARDDMLKLLAEIHALTLQVKSLQLTNNAYLEDARASRLETLKAREDKERALKDIPAAVDAKIDRLRSIIAKILDAVRCGWSLERIEARWGAEISEEMQQMYKRPQLSVSLHDLAAVMHFGSILLWAVKYEHHSEQGFPSGLVRS